MMRAIETGRPDPDVVLVATAGGRPRPCPDPARRMELLDGSVVAGLRFLPSEPSKS